MKGVKTITGSKYPRIGEATFYEVTAFHKGTVVIDPSTIKWKLYQFKDGKWDELSGPVKTGKKISFTFPQKWYAKQLLIEAYIFDAEGKAPPGFIVKPCMGDRKINNTEILNGEGKPITQIPKYGQHITLRATTENMVGEVLKLGVWERDSYSEEGHDPKGNQLLWSGNSKKVNNKGFGEQRILLSPDMMMKAGKSMFDGSEHEYYLLVEADKKYTISKTQPVSTEIVLSKGDHQIAKREPVPEKKPKLTDQKPVKIKNATGFDPIVVEGITKAVVDMPEELPKVEGIITAYFAKEEFTKETDEAAGEHKYTFANNNDNIDKDKIAGIIKKKVDAQVKADKKYAKPDDIKTVLSATSYKKGETISFKLHKLGANFIKINSAPLEEEIYVVAKTFLLDGKEVTIKIKEKDTVLVVADADLPVLEAKENGAEITALKATVENGIAKIKIKLRPKADTDLATWKDKLTGIKDGTHTYKFGSEGNNTKTAEQKKKIAGIIAGKIKATLAESKKFAKVEAIEKALTNEIYNKNEEITFDVYKTVIENLWLKVECQGTKKYEGDYLKKDGEYFVVGKTKEIIFPLLVKPENDDVNKWVKDFYWAAKQGNNQSTFKSKRGIRKHAARDLYTNPYETVVAIADGLVLNISRFYDGTDQVSVLHSLKDGREFIIRYGELDPSSITVKAGDEIEQKKVLGKTGKLMKTPTIPRVKINGVIVYMLHFEYFTASVSKEVDRYPLTVRSNMPFQRRLDLSDPLEILQEGYRNTFECNSENGIDEDRVDPNTLDISAAGVDFIKSWEKFESKPYNDSEGYCTIGYGHLIARDKCENITIPNDLKNGITIEKATQLFNERLPKFERAVKKDVTVPLYQNEYDALVSLLFNTGESFLTSGEAPKLYRNLLDKKYNDAGIEFLDITNNNTSGLVKRRQAEYDMFINNNYDATH